MRRIGQKPILAQNMSNCKQMNERLSGLRNVELERKSIGHSGIFSADHEECECMRIVERICNAGMHFHAVKLDQRSDLRMKPDDHPANRTKDLVVRTVNNAAVWSNRQSGPMLQVFAGR